MVVQVMKVVDNRLNREVDRKEFRFPSGGLVPALVRITSPNGTLSKATEATADGCSFGNGGERNLDRVI